MKSILVLILTLPILACLRPTNNEQNWSNPKIEYSISEQETATKQFPYVQDKVENLKLDSINMLDFFKRMRSKFNESGYSESEANEIYTLIFKEGLVKDAAYGMPSPDFQPKEITLEALKNRVSIHKIDTNTLEIFYWANACGRNFSHIKISTNEDKSEIIEQELIEKWSASYPC